MYRSRRIRFAVTEESRDHFTVLTHWRIRESRVASATMNCVRPSLLPLSRDPGG
jgi:hypothetical protein